jgi:hypothetical protein
MTKHLGLSFRCLLKKDSEGYGELIRLVANKKCRICTYTML